MKRRILRLILVGHVWTVILETPEQEQRWRERLKEAIEVIKDNKIWLCEYHNACYLLHANNFVGWAIDDEEPNQIIAQYSEFLNKAAIALDPDANEPWKNNDGDNA